MGCYVKILFPANLFLYSDSPINLLILGIYVSFLWKVGEVWQRKGL